MSRKNQVDAYVQILSASTIGLLSTINYNTIKNDPDAQAEIAMTCRQVSEAILTEHRRWLHTELARISVPN